MGSTSGLPAGILNVVAGGASEAALKAQDVDQRRARRSRMTLKELADALENIDEEAFASLLLEYERRRTATRFKTRSSAPRTRPPATC
jgi:hypothetical protein